VADSSLKPVKKNNIFALAINSITRGHEDTTATTIKSTDHFMPYDGKIIRHIYIQKFGFEKAFTDTSKSINYLGTRILNYLHKDSRDWVIRNNIFVSEKTALDPYKLADNERFLRSLSFIQDARIEILPIPNEKDSVDLEVITKDLFSISGEVNGASNNNFQVTASEDNLFGMGQRIQGSTLFQTNRSPTFGYEFAYQKYSIAKTFVNASVIYSTINNNLADGSKNVTSKFIQFNRPLISEFMHMAGGLSIGTNESFNSYVQPDSLFYKYANSTFDAWLGYALGGNKNPSSTSYRDRKFLSLRYFQNNFEQTPYQIGHQYNSKFNDREALLAQFTFFKQDFFKTNYIFGFGTTEDIPHGYNISLTTGWYRQLDLRRLYGGVEINKYVSSKKGDFFQYFLRGGGFLWHNNVQDASVLLGISAYSRLFLIGHLKMRQYLNISYTRLFNNVALDPLRINNPFGLRYFNSDSTTGQRRMGFHQENFFFLKYKLFGFKFAPFTFVDATLLTPEHENFSKTQIYYGLGGGVRTRNENLVFGTVEFRFVYFPNNLPFNNPFKVLSTINLQFRYNNTYVHAPDIVQLNNDPTNSVY
jgi:hypothetical protein